MVRVPVTHRTLAAVTWAAATVALCAQLGSGDPRAQEAPLALRVAPLAMAAPGRIPIEVAIAGLDRDLRPTIEGTITVGDQVIQSPQGTVVAARLPGEIDLASGVFRLGGVTIFHFPPVPPPDRNTPIAVEITVHQGAATVSARRTGMLLLPTLVVPGYLGDLATAPDPVVLSALARRGYRSSVAAPTLFWFTYPSRRLTLEQGAEALAAYVRQTVLPSVYAARINVIGYSEGGLLARWNLAFDPDWARLVHRFVMVGVPNEGTVAPLLSRWYPVLSAIATTPGARGMLPTYPFWRPTPRAGWSVPAGAYNASLTRLNTHALPGGVRAYAFYGTSPRAGTWEGFTGTPPDAEFTYGDGDGIVLTASVLGLPINGGPGLPWLADRLTAYPLPGVRHTALLGAAIPSIAAILAADESATAGSR
jgi:hypothetical protein